MRDSICVLSGGTGTPKLLQGLVRLVDPSTLSIIANTADDVVVGDIYVSPDVDAVLYTLAGIIEKKNVMQQLQHSAHSRLRIYY